jgi:tetratricopeptide (TPR) repeat protein
MLKPRVLLWHRYSYLTVNVNWTQFFFGPTQTDSLPESLRNSISGHPIAIQDYQQSSSRCTKTELLTWLSLFITLTTLWSNQLALAISPSDNCISILRAEALEAEGNGEYDKAESLYQKALTAARQSRSKIKVVEFLSRTVQARIENHKLLATDALVQEAIQLARSLKSSTASDSTLSVWMNDMADALYSKGEQTARDDVKEFCLKRYLDVKLMMEDQFDYQILGRASLLTTYLQHHGRYLEALPYVEKACSYVQRTKSNDLEATSVHYFGLGVAYLLANYPAKAELAFNQASKLEQNHSKDPSQEAMFTEALGNVQFEEAHFEAAKALYQQALKLNEQYIGKPAIAIGNAELSLGILEQKVGNRDEARRYFQASLDCFGKCTPPEVDSVNRFLHLDGLLYSGQVLAAEHLAQISTERGNLPLARSLQERAKKIRAQNPHWSACKNPDPDRYHMIWGHLPFPVDIIPTRLDLPL